MKIILFIVALGFLFISPGYVYTAGGKCVCDIKNTDDEKIISVGLPVLSINYPADCVDSQASDASSGFAGNEIRVNCSWKTDEVSNLVSDINGIESLNQLKDPDVKRLMGSIIAKAMGLMGSVALLMFVYGGVTWMMGSTSVAGGATKKDVLKSKAIIKWSVLGLLVIMASYVIVDFLFNVF